MYPILIWTLSIVLIDVFVVYDLSFVQVLVVET